MKALTPSQKGALLIVLEREPDPTYLSTHNGPSYIASGSARALEERGLVELVGTMRYSADRARLTDEGRALALTIDQQVRSERAGRRDERVPRSEVEPAPSAVASPVAGVQEGTTDDETTQCATVERRP